MKRLLFILFLLLTGTACTCYSQSAPANVNSTSPPSPNATSSSSLLGSYNVNYYSGRVTYSAPIYSPTISKIKIPIGVNYSSSGLKVQDMDGVVGIGWQFQGGGVITRYVQSLPDEDPNGYCGSNHIGDKTYSTLDTPYFNHIMAQTWDAEPDKFFFSFLNFSGVFELDQNGNPVLQSSYGLRIDYSPFNRTTGRMAGGLEDWIIRDMAGNQYYFGDGATETSNVTQHGRSKNTTHNFISSWYISKIVTADGQVINFQYQSFPSHTFSNYLNVYVPPISVAGQCSTTNHSSSAWSENTDTTIPVPLYLSKITSSIFEVDFLYNSNSPYLVEIDALQNGLMEYKFKLNYTSFTSGDGTQVRQALSNIQQLSVQNGTSLKLYSFGYNTTQNLPARNSIQTDYWGYYNSNAGTSNIEGYNGGDKTPDPIKTAANILTSVTNVYGGVTNFLYEQNDYAGVSSSPLTGGLRIRKISNFINGVNTGTENYSYNDPATGYSSGQLYLSPNNYTLGVDYLLIAGSANCIVSDAFYYSESLTSLADLGGVQTGYSYVTVSKADGSSVRYKFTNFSDYPDVVNKKLFYNNTENDGSAFETTPQFPQTSYAFARGKVLSEEDIDINQNVVKKAVNTYTLSTPIGDVKSIKAYAQRIINGIVGYYYNSVADFWTRDLLLTSKATTNNFYINSTLTGASSSSENYTYTLYSGNNMLASKMRTLSNGNTEKTTYRYPFDVLTSIPGSATSSRPVSYLVLNNIIAQPTETVTSVIDGTGKETLLGVSLTRYAATPSGTVKPSSQYRLTASQSLLKSGYQSYSVTPGTSSETEVIDPHLEQVQLFTKYDTQGNLTESNNPYTADGQSSYLYGYGKNYLIAQAKNAKSTEFLYDSFEESALSNVVTGAAHTGTHFYSGSTYTAGLTIPDSKSYVISYWYRNGGVWKYSGVQIYTGTSMSLSGGDAYDDVCIYPSDALITTYTYEPFAGMTSSGDSKGQTVSYEYDDYKRLINTRDMKGNIIKNYVYYFQGQ
ncbi:hypothetical protein [Mucilaginibacter sp. OK098]|uniref:hypothetical protein n=1 Tax=Mucilaginibacter sp. OK098 TaxID=1855297 RepID=UPI0009186ABC|nr:hypothetical protein [Mucilaginibacter sp. OK098]SHN12271.1 hypothetical protein SAMN05216524_105391 [Mucilaginibacter sp. OK098]